MITLTILILLFTSGSTRLPIINCYFVWNSLTKCIFDRKVPRVFLFFGTSASYQKILRKEQEAVNKYLEELNQMTNNK